MAAPAPLNVRLGDDTESGLANIVYQYLSQDLAESEKKRRQAAGLRGRVAMTAIDHEATVTVAFDSDGVTVWEGEKPPLDASIAGPYRSLVRLLQGESNPLLEHVRGRLRVRSSLRKPLFPLRVHALMKLTPEKATRLPGLPYLVLAGAVALVAAGAVAAAIAAR